VPFLHTDANTRTQPHTHTHAESEWHVRGWQTSPFGVVWFLLVNVSGTKSKKFT